MLLGENPDYKWTFIKSSIELENTNYFNQIFSIELQIILANVHVLLSILKHVLCLVYFIWRRSILCFVNKDEEPNKSQKWQQYINDEDDEQDEEGGGEKDMYTTDRKQFDQICKEEKKQYRNRYSWL